SQLAASLRGRSRHHARANGGPGAARPAWAARLAMSVPRATLRIQFHKHFTFADAADLVGYFAALGVSHLYASPIMTARPGSSHGYDAIDVKTINPELGGEDGLRTLVQKLRRHGMGLILDIVPNHMAVGNGNTWWTDVLAHGQASRYAKY